MYAKLKEPSFSVNANSANSLKQRGFIDGDVGGAGGGI